MKYECSVCNKPIHYKINLPFHDGSGCACHHCMRYLTTATQISMFQEERLEAKAG